MPLDERRGGLPTLVPSKYNKLSLMKYHLITYGCQMNVADSEEMARPLEARGFLRTADPDDADIILMNTCTVRDQAEHRAKSNLGRLAEWKEADPHRILIVAGCAASRWGASIKKRYPFIDLVAPATQIEEFPQVVEQVLSARAVVANEPAKKVSSRPAVIARSPSRIGDRGNPSRTRQTSEIPTSPPNTVADPRNDISLASRNDNTALPPRDGTNGTDTSLALFGSAATAYITIMRGCNFSCSYCIVPQVRGREGYRPISDILIETTRKGAEGFQEVMLLGQTVNSYRSNGLDFADLLRAVEKIHSVKAIRFMSPHPRYMTDRLITSMAECSKVCRHIHLPVQSGSNRTLKAMKRLYNREEYLEIVAKLRKAMPDIMITTDIIAGFPGEAPEDFADTLSLMREVRFDGLFAFKFSSRPGTTAAKLTGDDVSPVEKEKRLQRVLALNRELVGVDTQLTSPRQAAGRGPSSGKPLDPGLRLAGKTAVS